MGWVEGLIWLGGWHEVCDENRGSIVVNPAPTTNPETNPEKPPAKRLTLNIGQELRIRVHHHQPGERGLERPRLALADDAAELDDALHAADGGLDARVAGAGLLMMI